MSEMNVRASASASARMLIAPLLISLCAACGGGDDSAGTVATTLRTETGATRQPARPYLLRPTLQCLERRGATIDRGTPRDARLRALRDLAQRTSVLVRADRQVIGLAVARTASDAALLVSLLRAPGQHRLIQRRNAVLVFEPAARRTYELSRGCLRHG
jgi:hypothetical protein